MAINLTVTSPFAGYEIGNQISDADLVARYAESHPNFVVKVEVPDAPPSQPMPIKSAE